MYTTMSAALPLVSTLLAICCLINLSHQVSLVRSSKVKPQRLNKSQLGRQEDPSHQVGSNTSRYNRLFDGLQAISRATVLSQQQQQADDYVCAPYCSCSMVQVVDRTLGSLSASRQVTAERPGNLSRVFCESSLFKDLLTIDRRTQIIHISLSSNHSSTPSTSGLDDNSQQVLFRMPRLAQFNKLREIIIIKLKFEVCDSEVFKRGQKLLRFRLNYNQLIRISKLCLKHLDKLIELNLDHNNLSELESALFSGLTSLRTLSIAHNRLSELAAHQFVNLSKLTTLNLVGNSFKTINLHLFEPIQASLRYLLLAKNQIKSFIYSPHQTSSSNQRVLVANNATTTHQLIRVSQQQNLFLVGLVFKNLIKLNVDENKFERIKLLQLHRFYNVKYLSIRQNEIAAIRDKAFNGLKLVELNLAHNQLQTISKCAFCNSTIRRLVLSNNNISLPQPSVLQLEPQLSSAAAATAQSPGLPADSNVPPASPLLSAMVAAEPASSQNMLILSQSIFGPLFGQLEYLDLSNNQQLADQLEFLLEPLLKLEYLNLASVGLDRTLPSPSLFKNLRQLRYLNLSHNQLDQLVADTIEPLNLLEILDLSHNKFSELDESFLVTIDDMSPQLKLLNLGSNPWYCSQCKVAPLYDWILRSPIYNMTCISPLIESNDGSILSTTISGENDGAGDDNDHDDDGSVVGVRLRNLMIPLANNYEFTDDRLAIEDVDLMSGEQQQQQRQHSNELANTNYNLLPTSSLASASGLVGTTGNGFQARDSMMLLSDMTIEDDRSIEQTMAKVASMSELQMKKVNFDAGEYCLRCEFPSELSAFHIHELAPGDFKFCAGAAPRFAASEPKIGLTLAIVIIGALFCIIIVVIVMYRKKSNTYYTNEDMDQLNGSLGQTNGKKPVFSISSDNENNHYGDGTDYSSPPMSRSMDSYSQEDEDEEDLDEEEAEDEDEEEEEDLYEEEDNDDEDEEEDDGTLADEDDEDNDEPRDPSSGAAKEDSKRSNPLNTGQRQSGGSVDLQQSPQAIEEAERQRRSQIDEYNRRADNDSAKFVTHKNHQHPMPTVDPSVLTSQKSTTFQPASPSSRPGAHVSDSSLARTGRQATSKSQKYQPSGIDSRINQQPSSILTRNQSHPQQQRLTFAEQTSADSADNDGSSGGRLMNQRKSRSRDCNDLPKQESLENSNRQSSKMIFRTSQEERIPTMHRLPATNLESREATKQSNLQHRPEQGQHSLEKLSSMGTRQTDKQSGRQTSGDRATLRRHQTNREQTLNFTKMVQVPSQQSSSQLAQLQVEDLQQPTSCEGSNNKPVRARQRFAISKEISQTLGGESAKPALWTSGESQTGNGNVDLRPLRRGRAKGSLEPGSGKMKIGRQMGHPNPLDNVSTTSDDATTADSLALEHPNAGSDELLELEDPVIESMGYSGAALAMDSDANSLDVDDLPENNNDNNPNRLRAAISSHSALTQTGSGDLLD